MVAMMCLLGCRPAIYPSSVSNNISDEPARQQGVSKETIDYFAEKYPPDGWKPKGGSVNLAVGPVLVSRQAMLIFDQAIPGKVKAEVQSGNSKAVVEVTKGDGGIAQYYVAETSEQAQAMIMETLKAKADVKIFTFEDRNVGTLVERRKSYDQMRREGVGYFVDGNFGSADGKELKVYLRMADTATGEIVCAVSGQGANLGEATGMAANKLAELIK